MRNKKQNSWSADAFKQQVIEWAGKIGVSPTTIQVRPMKNKWASCSTSGRITFSSDLLQEDREFSEYVIVHELLHLQVPNHGKLFKSLLGTYVEEYQEIAKNRSVCGVF
ncbi:MAG: M48 family metallopeptidase [Thaumarchaeota archaeon]|nr:M48 family metallopeptidase [Nitrososphaerota archaeon]